MLIVVKEGHKILTMLLNSFSYLKKKIQLHSLTIYFKSAKFKP